MTSLQLLKTELENIKKTIKLYDTIIKNMDYILIKKVKGYTSMTISLS